MSKRGADWSDEENDLIVEDYFTMLEAELAGRAFVKAEHRRALLSRLSGRSEGSVEFKHQNISAVMLGLGQPMVEGYKPASQFQMSLVDAVIRRLKAGAAWNSPDAFRPSANRRGVQEAATFWLGPPPTFSNQPPPVDPDLLENVVRRFDPAANDERNRALGEAGEAFIMDYEQSVLRQSGRDDLAKQIVWTSKEEGDGAGYDIRSFEPDGSDRLIEVKTTNGWERTPFHLTRNEIAVADRHRDTWVLARLHNFVRSPKGFEIRPPLENHVELTPTSFLASLK